MIAGQKNSLKMRERGSIFREASCVEGLEPSWGKEELLGTIEGLPQ